MAKKHDSGHPDVMVSSTFRDLREHREEAIDAIHRLGFHAVGMEFDSSKAGKDIIASSWEMVDKAAAYFGILSHRYGGVPEDSQRNSEKRSITELEYRRSIERGIPVYMFLMGDNHKVLREDVEPSEENARKLAVLRHEVRNRSIVAEFDSPLHLKSLILQSLMELKERLSGDGASPTEVQSRMIPRPPRLFAIPNYIPGHSFVGRLNELAELDAWALSTDPMMIYEAIGGAGKSALTWQWLHEREHTVIPGVKGIFWYSFYEGGADMSSFAAYALAYVTGRSLKKFLGRKTADLMRELLPALVAQPFLLVLDGLERILVAYHRSDAAQARDDEVLSDGDHRACIRSIDEDLLREFVNVAPSRVLITSRLMPNALTNRAGIPLPGVRHRFLGGMTSDDAVVVLRAAGVRGSESAICRYFEENFENHALLLGVVAGLVNDYPHAPRDFDRWVEDPQGGAALRLSRLELTERRSHILAAALRGLAPDVRKLLSRIAALSDSVPFDTVAILSPFLPAAPVKPDEFEAWYLRALELQLEQERDAEHRQAIATRIGKQRLRQRKLEHDRESYDDAMRSYLQSTDYREAVLKLVTALQELHRRGLLQWDRSTNRYDMHPVVRGYSFDVLDNDERIDISNRIADHFQQRPADRYLEAKTLGDVQQSIEIVRALIRAGRRDEAVDFYRGEFSNAMLFNLGAYREVEVLVRGLAAMVSESDETNLDDRSVKLLGDLSICLSMTGRSAEAEQLKSRLLRRSLNEGDAYSLTINLLRLVATYEQQSRLALAMRTTAIAVRVAEHSHEECKAVSQTYRMDNALVIGDFHTAESAYELFREMTPPANRAIYRSGKIETSLCWLRFYQGILTPDLLSDARQKSQGSHSSIQSLSRLSGEFHLKARAYSEAVAAFEEALQMAYQAGVPTHRIEARLALARVLGGDHDRVRATFARLGALPIQSRPSLTLAEYHLVFGRTDRALDFAIEGYKSSWCDGPPYRRWWDLERARALLRELKAPEPALPPFDPNTAERVLWEDDIEVLIQKWSKERREASGKRKR